MVMGSSRGTFDTRRVQIVGPEPVQVEKGDFDRDGNLDLAVLSVGMSGGAGLAYTQSLHVLLGKGTGSFSEPFFIALRTQDPGARFAVADLDGDKRPDLALLEPGTRSIRFAFNSAEDAALEFEEPEGPWVADEDLMCIAAGDFNLDGNDDLAAGIANDGGGQVRVLLSDGVGGLTPGGTAELEASPACLTVADFDGDALVDIALGGSDSGVASRAWVISGQGAEGLGEPTGTALSAAPSQIAIGNLDGDGPLDLAFAQPSNNVLSSVLVTFPGDSGGVFLRGDANGDERADISDAVTVLVYLFLGGRVDCLEALDVDDDLAVNTTDAIYLLNFLFQGGQPPRPPFPEAGEDTQEPTLACGR